MGFRLPRPRWVVRREAADWLIRLQSRRGPDVQRKFDQWCADPRNVAAFERASRTYEQAALLRHSPVFGSTRQTPAIAEPRWRARPAFAAAAAAVVLVPLGALLVRGGAFPFGGTDAVMLMTTVGEIRQFDLADGSKVTLDTATKVDVEIGHSRRRAHLRYGRARFQVAQAAVPFVIETSSSSASTQSGVIDAEQLGKNGRIQVLAGAAEVSGAGQASTMGADGGVAVNQSGAPRTNVQPSLTDWTRGMLQFDGTPLADAVAIANRYSERHIVITGDFTALRVTGAFRAGDTTGLAKALAAAFRLTLEQRPDGNLLLSRSVSPHR